VIRSVRLTRASDNKSIILQALLDRDGVEYKHMDRAELLNLIATAINFLAEDEAMG